VILPVSHLSDRAVIRVAGLEAKPFLDRLITCDLDRVSVGAPRYGALLTPQGKIIADFIVHEHDDGAYFLDVPAACAPDLIKRLNLYKLRAKLAIGDVTGDLAVLAGWNAPAPPGAAPDPRAPGLGWRALVNASEASADAPPESYHAHRIAVGVPEGGRDFAFGDAFPHEALMDQMAGVDFDKGCYVGQEVVSRMQHRGTARTRIVPLEYDGEAAEPGAAVTAGDRTLGQTGTAAGSRGLAMIRLDRAADALAGGVPILAGGKPVRLRKPDWVRFPFPGDTASSAA
jgi:folate-binding protein YgfZ